MMPRMHSRIQAVTLSSEIGEFTEEARRIFRELGRGPTAGILTGECSPAIDVYETEGAVEITVDLPGVAADAVRVMIKGSAVLIAGEKTPRRGPGASNFHLVERGFGRFARTVRLAMACDAGRGRAVLARGELRLTLPKIPERRGRLIEVPVDTEHERHG
jgi:HSP20 family protein